MSVRKDNQKNRDINQTNEREKEGAKRRLEKLIKVKVGSELEELK